MKNPNRASGKNSRKAYTTQSPKAARGESEQQATTRPQIELTVASGGVSGWLSLKPRKALLFLSLALNEASAQIRAHMIPTLTLAAAATWQEILLISESVVRQSLFANEVDAEEHRLTLPLPGFAGIIQHSAAELLDHVGEELHEQRRLIRAKVFPKIENHNTAVILCEALVLAERVTAAAGIVTELDKGKDSTLLMKEAMSVKVGGRAWRAAA